MTIQDCVKKRQGLNVDNLTRDEILELGIQLIIISLENGATLSVRQQEDIYHKIVCKERYITCLI